MNLRSAQARRSRAGFTLIEQISLITILAVLAALIVPNLVAFRDVAERQRFISNLNGLVSGAAALSARLGEPVEVSLESDQVVLRTAGEEPRDLRAVELPAGSAWGGFLLNGQTVAESEWLPRFYPDGQARPGSVTLTLSNRTYSIRVEANGRASVVPGEVDPNEQLKWQAGELEQRL
jgi:type II secretory pathway pseudopilin PulG